MSTAIRQIDELIALIDEHKLGNKENKEINNNNNNNNNEGNKSTQVRKKGCNNSVEEEKESNNNNEMYTIRKYYENTYLFELESKVINIIANEEKDKNEETSWIIILKETIYHPQGGGQPYDKGEIISITNENAIFIVTKVIELKNNKNEIGHYGYWQNNLNKFNINDPIKMKIDESFRLLNANLHSAGHLIDIGVNVLKMNHTLIATKGYHFQDNPYVEYIPNNFNQQHQKELENNLHKVVNDIIAKNIKTNILFLNQDDYITKILKLDRKEKEKEYEEIKSNLKSKEIRVIQFEGYNGCMCGGTHVDTTSRIKEIIIDKIKKKRKKYSYLLQC